MLAVRIAALFFVGESIVLGFSPHFPGCNDVSDPKRFGQSSLSRVRYHRFITDISTPVLHRLRQFPTASMLDRDQRQEAEMEMLEAEISDLELERDSEKV